MGVDADSASRALLDTWRLLTQGVPGGWTVDESGALAAVSGLSVPTLNGVWVGDAGFAHERVSGLLDRVGATGLPHCLQGRQRAAAQLERLAESRGLAWAEDIPLMASTDPPGPERAPQADGLVIRQLDPREAGLHVDVAAAGFEVPAAIFEQLITPRLLANPEVRIYVGEVDGQPVTTALGVTLDDHVGIFNVATPPEHRGRGFGAAVTARVVNDGLQAGATWSWLQSSPSGHGIYERLGFRTLEHWPCWVMEV